LVRYSQQLFFKYGWALPAVLPLAQIVGRAAFTVLGIVYLIWAATALFGRRYSFDRRIMAAYLLLVLAYVLAVPFAAEPLRLLEDYLIFLVFSLVPFFTLASLACVENGQRRLIDAFAWVAALAVVLLYAQFAHGLSQPEFVPEHFMREDNLPFLAPFLIYGLRRRFMSPKGWWLAGAAAASILAYVLLSHGRAALVGLIVGMAAYAYLVLAQPLRRITLAAVALLCIAVFARGEEFIDRLRHATTMEASIDTLSSTRTAMWRNALTNPPENIWIGVGIGNASSSGKVFSVVIDKKEQRASKHLHNFLLDCWYETGLIGLGALLMWLGTLLHRGLDNWRHSPADQKDRLGVLLSASFAVIANALFSYSYLSKQFVIYLSLFLLVAAMAAPRTSTATAAPRVDPDRE
jgi:O-antigen ligase